MADPSELLVDRTLVLLRHAKAVQHDRADHARPLADRGRRDARAAGEWLASYLAAHDVSLDLVLCSTSARTRETWQYAAAAGLDAGDVRYDRRIYNATAETLLEVVREAPETAGTVLLIGHAPGVPRLAHDLVASGGDDLIEKFPTSGLAVLEHMRRWSALSPGDATLADFVTPRG